MTIREDVVEALVELGREAPVCPKHYDNWCSCTVRWFSEQALTRGLVKP